MSTRTETLRRPVGGSIPRRVSGPARGRTATRPVPAPDGDPLAIRLARRGQAIADSRFLDRLTRGRLWIPLLAAALMGLVFLQVSMLGMNAGIGRHVQQSQALERQNAVLAADVSRMEAEERIGQVAKDLGMVVPTAGGFHYVRADAGKAEVARALSAMQAPDETAVARAQGQVVPDASATDPVATTAPAPVAQAPAPTAEAPAAAPATTTTAPAAAPTPAPEPAPAAAPTATAQPATQAAAPAATAGAVAAPQG